MYFLALAVDFDGTIADKGRVCVKTIRALMSLKRTGRRLLLVTGRQMVDLREAFPHLELFDMIVAENGAVLYEPVSEVETLLSPPPSAELRNLLEQRGVRPISMGRAVIATWRPHEAIVLQAVEDLGLEMQVLFNKGAVMVLPSGVNKASGLREALRRLGISTVNTVGVGDAENDHAFLSVCGCSAAVANALPSLKKEMDIVLDRDHGAGVADLVRLILDKDKDLIPLKERGLCIGATADGDPVHVEPDEVILVIGNSGCGKSSYVTFLSERMADRKLEFCVIDPEGDYLGLGDAVTLGGLSEPPLLEDALHLLVRADMNVVVNVLAVPHHDRVRLFATILAAVRHLKETCGRPHWLVVDEAHYLLPATGDCSSVKEVVPGTVMVTLDTGWICREVLAQATCIIAMGGRTRQTLQEVAELLDLPAPEQVAGPQEDEFLLWFHQKQMPPMTLKLTRPRQAHHRHRGKYATGDVGDARSFYFRGPNKAEYLQARNLTEFLACAEKVDEATFDHHLRAHDYSAWFRHVIRDDALARAAHEIEEADGGAAPSIESLRSIITDRYVIGDSGRAGRRRDPVRTDGIRVPSRPRRSAAPSRRSLQAEPD